VKKEENTMVNFYTRNKLFAYLAGAALSLSSGTGRAGIVPAELAAVPESLLDEILDEAEGNTWRGEDKMVLLTVLSEDSRPQVRMRVTEVLTSDKHQTAFSDLEPILLKLAKDKAPEVRCAAARALSSELQRTDVLTRTRVVSEWTLSNDPNVRNTIARALFFDFSCLGVDMAAEHLSRDKDALVRSAVPDIARVRYASNPSTYQAILDRLSADPDQRTRRAARRIFLK
jgi:hypothetical protein